MSLISPKIVKLEHLNHEQMLNELKEKERALKLAHEQIVRLQNDLLEFSYAVSHNLRGPVSSILGLFELLNDHKFTPAIQKMIDAIKSKTETVDSIIYDLNSIVSLKKGVKDIFQVVDIDFAINEILDSNKRLIKSRNVGVDLSGIEKKELLVSKASFYSIIESVVENALIHGLDADKPLITVSSQQKGNNLEIIIADNGRGIDLEVHSKRIFKAYEKLNLNSTGKGLGLYLAKLQCEMLGGEINIESQPNNGTKVIIKLPVRDEDSRHVLLESNEVKFVYFPKISTIKAVWKKAITANEFDTLFRFILDFISKYKTTSWIADIRDSFNNEDELNAVRSRFKSRISEAGLERLALIVNHVDFANRKNGRNLENIKRAYSIPVAFFTSIDDAKNWITEQNKT